jgi:hypothetical protein
MDGYVFVKAKGVEVARVAVEVLRQEQVLLEFASRSQLRGLSGGRDAAAAGRNGNGNRAYEVVENEGNRVVMVTGWERGERSGPGVVA